MQDVFSFVIRVLFSLYQQMGILNLNNNDTAESIRQVSVNCRSNIGQVSVKYRSCSSHVSVEYRWTKTIPVDILILPVDYRSAIGRLSTDISTESTYST